MSYRIGSRALENMSPRKSANPTINDVAVHLVNRTFTHTSYVCNGCHSCLYPPEVRFCSLVSLGLVLSLGYCVTTVRLCVRVRVSGLVLGLITGYTLAIPPVQFRKYIVLDIPPSRKQDSTFKSNQIKFYLVTHNTYYVHFITSVVTEEIL